MAGPASTIRKRCHTFFAWKVFARSSAGNASHSCVGLAGRVHIAGEFDIAAQRQPADAPARAALVAPAGDLVPEADREGLGFDAAPAADEIMPELVNEHERADDEQEATDGEQETGSLCRQVRQAPSGLGAISARASRSISSTSSIEPGAGGSQRASVSATIVAISRNPIRVSRKDFTAISLAALRIAGAPPPALRRLRGLAPAPESVRDQALRSPTSRP